MVTWLENVSARGKTSASLVVLTSGLRKREEDCLDLVILFVN